MPALASLCLIALSAFGGAPSTSVREPGPGVSEAALDQARIRQHLQETEAALRKRDASALKPSLQAARLRNLDVLHDYWVRGVFPRNTDHSGQRVPYFIDDGGRACAVGHLMMSSGAQDVAQAIARHERNDRLVDITTPGVGTWIERSGLTLEEHARIQPSYCGCGQEPFDPVCGVDGNTYPNACLASECAGVKIAHAGECPGVGESGDGESVGATTGVTGTSSGATGDGSGTGASASTSASTSASAGDPSPTSGDAAEEKETDASEGCRVGSQPSTGLFLLLVLGFGWGSLRRRGDAC